MTLYSRNEDRCALGTATGHSETSDRPRFPLHPQAALGQPPSAGRPSTSFATNSAAGAASRSAIHLDMGTLTAFPTILQRLRVPRGSTSDTSVHPGVKP